jgi:hypothetical protein
VYLSPIDSLNERNHLNVLFTRRTVDALGSGL